MATDKQKFQYRWRSNRGRIEMAQQTLMELTKEFTTPNFTALIEAQLDSLCGYLHRINDSRAIELGIDIKRWGYKHER